MMQAIRNKRPHNGMIMYDLSDRLEQAMDRQDVACFGEVLEEMCSHCGEDQQQLTRLLGPLLAKAAKTTPNADNLPAVFVSSLLARGVNCNVTWHSNTPLILAAERGNKEVVRLLLDAGSDVNRTDTETRTALHWASMCGHLDTVLALLEAGATVDTHDRLYGFTPLMLAARQGHTEVVRALLRSGQVNVNGEDRFGDTALMDAVRNNQFSCLRLLLEYNVDVNHQDNEGNTALLTAVLYKRLKAVLMLIRYNCDLHVASKNSSRVSPNLPQSLLVHLDEKDAFELCIADKNWELAKILCEYGAKVHNKFKYLEHHRLMEAIQAQSDASCMLPAWLAEQIANPRSLKEISRDTIRRQLPSGCLVIPAIQSFFLPVSLKDYLLLKELEDL